MLLYSTLTNFVLLIFSQIIIFKIFKFKKKWHLISTFVFIIIFFLLNNKDIKSIEFLNYLIFNSTILICYIIFLTLIFNESPTLFYLESSDLSKFKERGFVKDRLNLMISDNLINKDMKITPKGINLLKISNLLSNIFFKEND